MAPRLGLHKMRIGYRSAGEGYQTDLGVYPADPPRVAPVSVLYRSGNEPVVKLHAALSHASSINWSRTFSSVRKADTNSNQAV